MLPRQYRLTRSRDIVRTRRSGRPARAPLAALYVLPTGKGAVRAGFSVNKRVGKATVRNRVKRRMREALRAQLPGVRPGHDLVFVARPEAAQATYHQLAECLSWLLRKSGLLGDPAGGGRNA
ncbi:MAG TPA: ribonuclease P protein component [Chloroflexota bacterium]|nr:ribonuclease P protein component [Chloroflexota bacterium]